MKTFTVAMLTVLLLPGIAPGATCSRMSPLIGRWAVDVSRLPMATEARPRSVTITFAGSADATWSTQVDIVDAGGNASHATGTTRLDGTPATVTGSAEADVAATTMPRPDVLVMSLAKGGEPANTRIYAVAADGRTMVETAAYFGTDGKPVLRTHYFTRLP